MCDNIIGISISPVFQTKIQLYSNLNCYFFFVCDCDVKMTTIFFFSKGDIECIKSDGMNVHTPCFMPLAQNCPPEFGM